MRGWLTTWWGPALAVGLAIGTVALAADDSTPGLTVEQQLKAEKHKNAVLQLRLAQQSLEARTQQLQQEETALTLEFCGKDGTFDWAMNVCTAPVKGEPKS